MKKLLLGLGIIFLGSQVAVAMDNDGAGSPSCFVQAGVNAAAAFGCALSEPIKSIAVCIQFTMGDPENDWNPDEMARFENRLSFSDIKSRLYAAFGYQHLAHAIHEKNMQWVEEEAMRTKSEIRRLHLRREFEKRKAQEFEKFCARYEDEEE